MDKLRMDLLKIKHHEGEEQQVKIKGIIQEGYLQKRIS